MRLRLAVAIVVAAFAGCGDDGDGESAGATTTPPQASTSTSTTTTSGNGGDAFVIERAGPKKQVRRAVEAVLTSGDAAGACGRYVTERYLKAAYGGRQGCVNAQVPGSAADKLDFEELRINGDRATAVVVPSGGPYSGERVTVSLVHDGPRWAVDALEADIPVGP